MVSFLHSADWQIGKPYARVVEPDKRARLRQVRLEAIETVGAVARDAGAAFLLVAGDLFDSPTPSASDISAVCFAMGRLALPVLVIPGNHDHGAPGALWHSPFFQSERERRAPQLQVLLARQPLVLEQAVVLPCPLLRRQDTEDPTAWLQELNWGTVPTDRPRIVLAHGSVHGFGPVDLEADEENPAAANNRLQLPSHLMAEIDYVALGDWHGLKRVNERIWYPGSPEQDRFPRSSDYRSGQVLRVEVERGNVPRVEAITTGRLGWHQLHVHFNGDDDLGRFEQQLASLLGDRVGQDLLLLEVEGQLSLQGQHQFDLILEQLEARLLRLKRRGHPQISADDNEVSEMTQRPGDPLIARVAAQLQQRLEAPRGEGDPAVARLALAELHRLVREGSR
jgi:DNA repair exonuclease SbcCD nuclease subunit